MPRLKLKGIDTNKICSISKSMIDELQEFLNCPRSYFTIECSNSVFVFDGEIVPGTATVEIAWFGREQEIQDKVAKIVTAHIQAAGYENVKVIFTITHKSMSYENGKHF